MKILLLWKVELSDGENLIWNSRGVYFLVGLWLQENEFGSNLQKATQVTWQKPWRLGIGLRSEIPEVLSTELTREEGTCKLTVGGRLEWKAAFVRNNQGETWLNICLFQWCGLYLPYLSVMALESPGINDRCRCLLFPLQAVFLKEDACVFHQRLFDWSSCLVNKLEILFKPCVWGKYLKN